MKHRSPPQQEQNPIYMHRLKQQITKSRRVLQGIECYTTKRIELMFRMCKLAWMLLSVTVTYYPSCNVGKASCHKCSKEGRNTRRYFQGRGCSHVQYRCCEG